MLVIDDNSPDGTGEIADRLAAELPFVSVLHRERKEGLGPAYLAGFRRALDEGAELVLEMDCDFSHDPADVPRLIAAVEDGADLALGSRYVPGGRIGNWGADPPRDLARRLPVHARLAADGRRGPDRRLQVLPPRACSRRSTSTRSPRRATRSRSRLTYRAKRPGFRVVEVPIAFDDRDGRAARR